MSETFRPPHGPCFADLKGKAALVTGGGAGIGRGITIRLAAEGMHVFLCGRREAMLTLTADLIRQAGGNATPIVADISREDDVANLFAKIREQTAALDLLVHNAALVRGRTFAQTDSAFWHQMIATNLDSAFYLAKQCAEMMIPRRSGNMIFITTIGAARAHYKMPAYDASKAALDSFTRSLALELAEHRIRVNAIGPGATTGHDTSHLPESEWTRRSARAFDAEIDLEVLHQPHIPMGRFGTPAEIGAVAAFLASEQSSYITGQTLYVDGGVLAQLSPRSTWI